MDGNKRDIRQLFFKKSINEESGNNQRNISMTNIQRGKNANYKNRKEFNQSSNWSNMQKRKNFSNFQNYNNISGNGQMNIVQERNKLVNNKQRRNNRFEHRNFPMNNNIMMTDNKEDMLRRNFKIFNRQKLQRQEQQTKEFNINDSNKYDYYNQNEDNNYMHQENNWKHRKIKMNNRKEYLYTDNKNDEIILEEENADEDEDDLSDREDEVINKKPVKQKKKIMKIKKLKNIKNRPQNKQQTQKFPEKKITINFQGFMKERKEKENLDRERETDESRSVSKSPPYKQNIKEDNEEVKEQKKNSLINFPTRKEPLNDKGTLTTMCSLKEMMEREEQYQLDIFELDPDKTKKNPETGFLIKKAHPDYVIKKYQRPGGDLNKIDYQEVRTPEALNKTMQYIIDEIVDSDNIPNKKFSTIQKITFSDICLFLLDRFKGITKDFTVQNIKGSKYNIEANEQMARFLIMCINETLDIETISGSQGLYKLNMNQLNRTLTSLLEFYEYTEKEKTKNENADVYISPNQDEIISYFLLFSMKQDPKEFMSILNKIPNELKHAKKIAFAVKIAKSYYSKDWKKFMKLLKDKECDYLTACLMMLFFVDIRIYALKEIGYSRNKNFCYKTTLRNIFNNLPFENIEECVAFLNWYGFEIKENFDNDTQFDLIQVKDNQDVKPPLKTNHMYVQNKKGNMKRKEIMKAAPLTSLQSKVPIEIIETPKQIIKPLESIASPFEKINKEKKIPNILPSFTSEQNVKENTFIPQANTISIFTFGSTIKKNYNELIEVKKDSEIKKQIQPSPLKIQCNYDEKAIKAFINICNILRGKFFKLKLFYMLQYINERIKMKEKRCIFLITRKKIIIFSALRKNAIDSKYNKQYLNELSKYNSNFNSILIKKYDEIPNALPKKEYLLSTFEELKYFLLSKHIIPNDSKYLNYLQINIYTTKKLFVDTNIFQNLQISQDKVATTNEEVIISDPNIYFNNTKYSLYIRIIFLDQIMSLEDYIYINQKNLNKFIYGLVFFEYEVGDSFNKLITLFEMSLGDLIKKKLIYTFFRRDTIFEDDLVEMYSPYISFLDKYNYPKFSVPPIYINQLSKFSFCYKKSLTYSNNQNFINLFKEHISFSSFNIDKTFFSLSKYNNSIDYLIFIRRLEDEYSYISYGILSQQILLGISLIQIISQYYSDKLKEFANVLYDIPEYDSNEKIFELEDTSIKLASYFYKIATIDIDILIDSISNLEPMQIFDSFVKEIIVISMNEGIDRKSILSYQFDIKKDFYSRSEIKESISIYLITFYGKLIHLVSETFDVYIDEEVSFSKIENIYKEKRDVIYSKIKGLIEKLYEKYGYGKDFYDYPAITNKKESKYLIEEVIKKRTLLCKKRKRDFIENSVIQRELLLKYIPLSSQKEDVL